MIYFIYNNMINWVANTEEELNQKLISSPEYKEYEFFTIEDEISNYKIQGNKIVKKLEIELLQEKLQESKSQKLQELSTYDSSSAVNSFLLFGNALWLAKEVRISLANTAWSKDRMGIARMPISVESGTMILGVQELLDILSAIEDYANLCYINTYMHRVAIEQIATIAEVEQYDFTQGYPEKLSFAPMIYPSLND